MRETESQHGHLGCVAVGHLDMPWSRWLWAIQQVAFWHLLKCFVGNRLLFSRASSFQTKMGEAVLE